jgi:hypothetical protein
VATVVVVSPPLLLYSYRAAAKPAATPTMTEVESVPRGIPTEAEQLLRLHCMKCHQGDAPKTGLPFFDLSGELIALLPRKAILADSPHATAYHMPPGEAKS